MACFLPPSLKGLPSSSEMSMLRKHIAKRQVALNLLHRAVLRIGYVSIFALQFAKISALCLEEK